MPRTARILLANTPHHIVQRGHNRKAVFIEPADYQFYLNNLAEWKEALNVKVYSFCLMTNHVHLILESGDETDTLSLLMKRLAGRQTRRVNKLEKRTGSLWEGRFKASPIERDAYLLQCCKYVEMNPVKAKMALVPDDYPWSSYRHRTGSEYLQWLDTDKTFISLGNSVEERTNRYREFVASPMDDHQSLIQHAVQRNQLTGTRQFIDEIELRIGLRIEHRAPGRPRKNSKVQVDEEEGHTDQEK